MNVLDGLAQLEVHKVRCCLNQCLKKHVMKLYSTGVVRDSMTQNNGMLGYYVQYVMTYGSSYDQ
jgi:hypothetical protein